MKKKISSLIMVAIMMVGILGNSITANATDVSQNIEKKILGLVDQRASLLLDSTTNAAKISAIDSQLERLGVDFLTNTQVDDQFPKAKSDYALAMSGNTKNRSRVATPSSNKNSWMSYRSTVTYNGKSYNVQRLIAQPKSTSSPLATSASRIVSFKNNWKAGASNLFQSVAQSSIGAIPGASLAVSVYDAVKSAVSGISTTTTVTIPNVTYSWSSTETVVFTYIRLTSQTDDYQWLSLVSTKTVTEVGWQIPKFNYVNSSGKVTLTPNVIQGKRTITCTPSGYDNNNIALNQYVNGFSGPTFRAVSSITISGPESKAVQTIYPVYPQFPLHCE